MRTSGSTRIVLDTSVLAKWLKPRDEKLLAGALFLRDAAAAGSIRVSAPILLYYEFGNLLLKKTLFDEGELDRTLGALLDLPVIPVPPTAGLLVRAGRIGAVTT